MEDVATAEKVNDEGLGPYKIDSEAEAAPGVTQDTAIELTSPVRVMNTCSWQETKRMNERRKMITEDMANCERER